MTGKADVQAPASLKDGTSDWRILDWPGLAEGGQTMCSWEFLKGAGRKGRNLPLFKICLTFQYITTFFVHTQKKPSPDAWASSSTFSHGCFPLSTRIANTLSLNPDISNSVMWQHGSPVPPHRARLPGGRVPLSGHRVRGWCRAACVLLARTLRGGRARDSVAETSLSGRVLCVCVWGGVATCLISHFLLTQGFQVSLS